MIETDSIKDLLEESLRESVKDNVVSTAFALQIALDLGLDLIEVNSNVQPPICKIADFGKYKYDLQKNNSTKASNHKKDKEIHMNLSIGAHDFEVKTKHAIDFLQSKHIVRFVVNVKFREVAERTSAGFVITDRIVAAIGEHGKIQEPPKFISKKIILVFGYL